MKLSIALAYAYAYTIFGPKVTAKHVEAKAKAEKDVFGFDWSAIAAACKEICATFPGTYTKTDGIDYVFIPSGAVLKGGASLKVFEVTNSSNPCVYTAELSWSLVDGGSTESGTIKFGGNSFGCTGALQLHSEEQNSNFIAVHLLPKSGNIEVMMSLSAGGRGQVTSAVTGPYELLRESLYF
jgi:hypothetical protein